MLRDRIQRGPLVSRTRTWRESRLSPFGASVHRSRTRRGTLNRRITVGAVLAVLLVAAVPQRVALAQDACDYVRCVRVTVFGYTCEICDCWVIVEGEDGQNRFDRSTIAQCGVQ